MENEDRERFEAMAQSIAIIYETLQQLLSRIEALESGKPTWMK